MQTIKLHNGVEMPMEGFGVFQVSDLSVCEQAVSDAIATGYRLIDTASSYKNETAVGAAIRKSGVSREDLFVTSKAFINEMGYEQTKAAFQRTLDNLGFDYLDLYLITCLSVTIMVHGERWKNCTKRGASELSA